MRFLTLILVTGCSGGATDTDIDPGTSGEEIPYDGIDNDNDPSTPDDDLDSDGFIRADDCDDADASAFPGNPAGDTWPVDNDCDGASVPFPGDLEPLASCEGASAGATSIWVGDFRVENGQVGGTEVEYLFANDAWENQRPADAYDCTAVYRLSGTSVGTQLTVDAVLDTERSTCVAALLASYPSTYSATFSYTACSGEPCETTVSLSSGTVLGDGLFDGVNVGYQSAPRCTFF